MCVEGERKEGLVEAVGRGNRPWSTQVSTQKAEHPEAEAGAWMAQRQRSSPVRTTRTGCVPTRPVPGANLDYSLFKDTSQCQRHGNNHAKSRGRSRCVRWSKSGSHRS